MSRTIQMGLKAGAFFGNLAHGAETENLIAAAVGQNRSMPTHKSMPPTHLAHDLVSRSEVPMIRVGEKYLAAYLAQSPRQHAFYRGLGAYRHECRRFNDGVWGH